MAKGSAAERLALLPSMGPLTLPLPLPSRRLCAFGVHTKLELARSVSHSCSFTSRLLAETAIAAEGKPTQTPCRGLSRDGTAPRGCYSLWHKKNVKGCACAKREAAACMIQGRDPVHGDRSMADRSVNRSLGPKRTGQVHSARNHSARFSAAFPLCLLRERRVGISRVASSRTSHQTQPSSACTSNMNAATHLQQPHSRALISGLSPLGVARLRPFVNICRPYRTWQVRGATTTRG